MFLFLFFVSAISINYPNILELYGNITSAKSPSNCTIFEPCTISKIAEIINQGSETFMQIFVHLYPGIYPLEKDLRFKPIASLVEFRKFVNVMFSHAEVIFRENPDTTTSVSLFSSSCAREQTCRFETRGLKFQNFKRSLVSGYFDVTISDGSIEYSSSEIISDLPKDKRIEIELEKMFLNHLTSPITKIVTDTENVDFQLDRVLFEDVHNPSDRPIVEIDCGGVLFFYLANFTVLGGDLNGGDMFKIQTMNNLTTFFDKGRFENLKNYNSIINAVSKSGSVDFDLSIAHIIETDITGPTSQSPYFSFQGSRDIVVHFSYSLKNRNLMKDLLHVNSESIQPTTISPISILYRNMSLSGTTKGSLLRVSVSDYHSLDCSFQSIFIKDFTSSSSFLSISGANRRSVYNISMDTVKIGQGSRMRHFIDTSSLTITPTDQVSIKLFLNDVIGTNLLLSGYSFLQFPPELYCPIYLNIYNSQFSVVGRGSFVSLHLDHPKDNSRINIVNSHFSNFSSNDDGGVFFISRGVYDKFANRTVFEVRGSTFDRCSSLKNGGSVFGMNALIFTQESTFKNCYSQMDGGAIYLDHGTYFSSPRIREDYRNNTAGVNGGAIYVSNFVQCCFVGKIYLEDNTARDGSGGALWVSMKMDVSVPHKFLAFSNEVVISHNHAGKYGGGVYIGDLEEKIILNSDVTRNEAVVSGGGVYFGFGTGQAKLYLPATLPSHVTKNKAKSGNGEDVLTMPTSFDLLSKNEVGETASSSSSSSEEYRCLYEKEKKMYKCVVGKMEWMDFYSQKVTTETARIFTVRIVIIGDSSSSSLFTKDMNLDVPVTELRFDVDETVVAESSNRRLSLSLTFNGVEKRSFVVFTGGPSNGGGDNNGGAKAWGYVLGIGGSLVLLVCVCVCLICCFSVGLLIVVLLIFSVLPPLAGGTRKGRYSDIDHDDKELGTYLEL